MNLQKTFNEALAALNSQNFVAAERLFRKILKLEPSHFDTLFLFVISLMYQNKHDEAEKYARRAIGFNPRHEALLSNYGLILKTLGRLGEALEYLNRALAINQNNVLTIYNRGLVLFELKDYMKAVDSFDKVISIDPTFADAFSGKGNAFREIHRHDHAITQYERALSLNSNLESAWLGRGNVFYELKRYDEAISDYNKALALKPDLENAWLGRGNVFCDLKRYDEAISDYNKALALNPNLVGAWLGRGGVFFGLNRDHEALQCYDKVLDLKRDLPEAQWNKALVLLSLGQYEEGWKLYEWRWKKRIFSSPVRHFKQPLWLNDFDIHGKTILVHAEQGFGDTIQFARYLNCLEKLDCRIVFEVQKPLLSLFKSQEQPWQVISKGEPLPPFDVQCPLLSLPLAFKTTPETIPGPTPYLFADSRLFEKWQGILGNKSKKRIGLCWSGNVIPDANRSVVLSQLLPILDQRIEWHSLQKELRDGDREALNASPLRDHVDNLHDFSDTAALIAQLDQVISIDTSVAHLAGALGKQSWILLPFHPDFRWFREQDHSPWYPTAKLFRQTQIGDWSDVIKALGTSLISLN